MSESVDSAGEIGVPELVLIENLELPPALSGQGGRNRAYGRSQIAAKDDRAAVLAWLARFTDSPATFASYRKESERLLLWCLHQHRKALSDLAHEDLLVYQHFLKNPQPADVWVMAPGKKPGRDSLDWRPFAGPLSDSSQRQAMLILNGLFNWLVAAGYLAGNPLALARRVRPKRTTRITRSLPRPHWVAVQEAIRAMPAETPLQAAAARRARWMFSLLYIGGLRVTELCTAAMGDLVARQSPDGTTRWWIDVLGKGGKERLVPATPELMDEAKRYRVGLGLDPLPRPGEVRPLVGPIHGDPMKHMDRSTVHGIVKEIMQAAADLLRRKGPEFEDAARHIEQASTHWMRHTSASHLSNRADLKVVRDNMGHESIATSNLYLHTEDDVRHDQTSAIHRLDW